MDSHDIARIDWATSQAPSNSHFEAALEALAHSLQDEFMKRRAELQQAEQVRSDAERLARGRKPKDIWCQIQIRARTKDGTYRLEWQTKNWNKEKKKWAYGHIPRNKETGLYDLRSLAEKAHKFEVPLVEEIERRARRLRDDWKALTDVRRRVRASTGAVVEQVAPAPKALADRNSGLAHA